MPTFRYCKKHEITYEGKHCPKCPPPEEPARSTKYTTNIIIPPHMRAGS